MIPALKVGAQGKVRRLLADPNMTTVVAGHRDRLGRMDTELVESALSAHWRRLVVLDDGEVDGDLVHDMVEVLTSFCAQRDIGSQTVISAGRQDVGHE